MDFDKFLRDLQKSAADLIQAEAKDYAKEAAADVRGFLKRSRAKLKEWTRKLADGDLDAGEFEFLVRGLKSLAKMDAVRQAGMAKIRAERLANALLDLVVDAAKGLI
jgi:hypothetical protein